MSATATAIVIAAVVVVTVVSALFTAATAVMFRDFDTSCNKLHLENEFFSCKRMVGIEINRIAFDLRDNYRNNFTLVALHLENCTFMNVGIFREF